MRNSPLAFAFLAAVGALASVAGWLNRRLRIVESYPWYRNLP